MRTLCAGLLLLGVAACDACGAPPCAPEDAGGHDPAFERMGQLGVSSFLEALEVQAVAPDRVYFCSGVQGLRMVDASDPATPTTPAVLRSSLSDPSFPRCQHVAASGDIVYFTNRGDEVQPRAFLSALDTSRSPPLEVALHVEAGASSEAPLGFGLP